MSLVPVLERLEALDVPALQRGGVAMALLDVKRLRRFVDACEVSLAGRLNDLAAEGSSAPAADVLKQTGATSSAHAAAVERGAATAAANPELGSALVDGKLGLEHVNAYGKVESTLPPEQQEKLRSRQAALLAGAGSTTPEQFKRAVEAVARQIREDDGESVRERQRNDRSVRFGYRKDDGMGFIHALLDPETAARVFAMLTAERDALAAADTTLTAEQATADALAALVLSAGRAKHPGRVELVIFIDWETLRNGLHTGSVSFQTNGEHVPVSMVRRLCCEAHIIPMVLGGAGEPLEVGRARRLANRSQRRALRKLYRTCAHPHCEVGFDECEVHHVVPFERGGPTDLANLLPLCSRHHHLVHEGGWSLSIDHRRSITLRRPDGAIHLIHHWRPPPGEDARRRAA